MKRIMLFITLFFCVLVNAQTDIPFTLENGHIIVSTYTLDMKPIKVLVDTGSSTTIVLKKELLTNSRKTNRIVYGLNSEDKVTLQGIFVCIGISTTAIYQQLNKDYDVILGLDWLVTNNIVIDLPNFRLTSK